MEHRVDRREFLAGVAGAAIILPKSAPPRLRFAVIGLNHGHIYSRSARCSAAAASSSRSTRRSPTSPPPSSSVIRKPAARSETEILEDQAVQLVLSAAIPDERAPLGIRVMQHGKDYMADKPGITTLAQLAEVRSVQAQTRRIYSIMYSERSRTGRPSRPPSSSRPARSATSPDRRTWRRTA